MKGEATAAARAREKMSLENILNKLFQESCDGERNHFLTNPAALYICARKMKADYEAQMGRGMEGVSFGGEAIRVHEETAGGCLCLPSPRKNEPPQMNPC